LIASNLVRFDSLGILRWREDLPLAATPRVGADDTTGFHLVDETGSARVADAEPALEKRDRGLAEIADDGDGLVEEFVLF
jgi:hypothetical protein